MVQSSLAHPKPPGGDPLVRARPTDGRCLLELRARLAHHCDGGEVREGLDAVVGPLLGGPLVDGDAARSVGDADLVWCAQAVQRAINALEGTRSALAAEAARRRLHARRGEASVAETLAGATGLSGTAARRVERDAVSLSEQPQVAEALGRGDINADQAAVVAGAEVPDEVRSALCADAPSQNTDQTRRAVRAAESAWRRESDAQRRARQRTARSASMWVDQRNGMWQLRASLDPLTGDAINRLLERTIQQQWRSDKDLPESQRRSVAQRAADALASLLAAQGRQPAGAPTGEGATGNGPNGNGLTGNGLNGEDLVVPPPTQMIVLTTLDNLRNGDANTSSVSPSPLLAAPGAAGVTETGTELSAGELRKLACDTLVVPVVMGGPSEVLDVGRATRTIPPAIRRALIARDQGCVWPGCDRAPIHCDGHHIQHWFDDGPTCVANLALLCHSHHHRLHEYNQALHPPRGPTEPGTGWTVTPAPPPTPSRHSTRQNC